VLKYPPSTYWSITMVSGPIKLLATIYNVCHMARKEKR
jgi:hypothetical protein